MTNRAQYSNPRCYLKHLGDCSEILSAEHIISANLLRRMSKDGRTIKMDGLRWQKLGEQNRIGINSLVSKCLCDKHNSELSPLDAEAGKFFAWLHELGSVESKLPNGMSINGRLVERWMLKSMVAYLESDKSGTSHIVSPKLLNLITSAFARWPTGWGLYVSQIENPGTFHVIHGPVNSFSMGAKYDPKTNALTAVEVKVCSVNLVLVLASPSSQPPFGVKRPGEIRFEAPEGNSCANIIWSGMKSGATITFHHSEYVYPENIRSVNRLTHDQRTKV